MDYKDYKECEFWCWKHKLQGVLQLLSLLSGYVFSETDAAAVAHNLHLTSADRNEWFEYDLSAARGTFQAQLALDEDDRDIVFVKITASAAFQKQIWFLGQIQDSLKTIEIDFP